MLKVERNFDHLFLVTVSKITQAAFDNNNYQMAVLWLIMCIVILLMLKTVQSST